MGDVSYSVLFGGVACVSCGGSLLNDSKGHFGDAGNHGQPTQHPLALDGYLVVVVWYDLVCL